MKYLYRHLESDLVEALPYAKALLVVGARQVGKTTLLRHAFPTYHVITFDPVTDVMRARENPDLFLDSISTPVILDEIQYAPELFPALKRRLDASPETGRYILTGSQNPLLLKEVSESLAGRVMIFELESYTTAEGAGCGDSPPWLVRFLENGSDWKSADIQAKTTGTSLVEALWRGSLPDAVSLPLRILKRHTSSYIRTYLERDVRLAGKIEDVEAFGRFLSLCAALSGQEINRAQLGREIGISPNTANRWLSILKATYQWHELPPYQGNVLKRISGKPKGLLADTGIMTTLLRLTSDQSLLSSPQLGAIFETFMDNEIRKQLSRFSDCVGLYHWRTLAGAEVDCVLEKDGVLHPFEVKCKDHLDGLDLRGIRAFRETYPGRVGQGAVLYAGKDIFWAAPDTLAIPWNAQ